MSVIPESMRCIEITAPGGAEVLQLAHRPVPKPGPGEVLVKVAAAGVNRPDVLQRMGGYPAPPGASDIPGLELAGRVVKLGTGIAKLEEGDDVCALVTGGGYAEYCVVPEPQALPIPLDFSPVMAAALPETFFTVWTNVFERGRLAFGETLLVHGGSSGIGTTAIQLAVNFGATVLTTVGSAEKAEACLRLGAKRAINYRTEDFVSIVKDLTAGKGVNLILDMVGGDYIQKNIRSLAVEGRLVNIAFLKGSKAEVDLLPVMLKRLTISGSTLRAREIVDKADIANALRERVWPLLNSGMIKPLIHATFPLAEAARAHELMESSQHIGKIVLTVDPSTPVP